MLKPPTRPAAGSIALPPIRRWRAGVRSGVSKPVADVVDGGGGSVAPIPRGRRLIADREDPRLQFPSPAYRGVVACHASHRGDVIDRLEVRAGFASVVLPVVE